MSGNNCGFYIPVSVQHMSKNLLQARQRSLPGYIVGRTNLLFGNQTKGAAHRVRGMVERSFERDLRIVQTIGVELDLGPGGASAKKVNCASLADHLGRPLPC